ncbi:MAG: trypsin-like serine peptidase [Thermoanaerobaculia bacterium]
MSKLNSTSILRVACVAVIGVLIFACPKPPEAVAQDVRSAEPQAGAQVETEDMEAAQTHDRMLTADQLSEKVKKILFPEPPPSDEPGPEAFGTGGHPFTTKRASAQGGTPAGTPVELFPYRPTGKLFMQFGAQTFVCSASVIRKGLLVTAAHCVHNFGDENNGWAGAVTFQPARHDGSVPFGTWTGSQWWIPTVYWNGSDNCTVPGIVCENDVAVVVVQQLGGQSIGDVTGMYGFPVNDDDFGYVPNFLGQTAGQITQLGYPARDYSGVRMIRTDSLGYWDDPNNVIIGSAQTGGSSGGPWLMNFGIDTSYTGPPASDDTANQVVATTSWGFISGAVKVQGASRFSSNAAFPAPNSNIQALVNAACAANPGAC